MLMKAKNARARTSARGRPRAPGAPGSLDGSSLIVGAKRYRLASAEPITYKAANDRTPMTVNVTRITMV